ncbi:MAG: hypothetical protein IKS43_01765 [Clostridia bacterium]|nr:hypothetical protein [Clostridia bacterium]
MLPLILTSGFFSDWAAAWADNIGGLVLIVIGMILITVEMIIPGFGAAGISGGIALIAGLIIGSEGSLPGAMFSLLIVVVLLAIIAILIFKSAIRGKLSKSPVVLNTAIDAASTELTQKEAAELVGKTGRTLTSLRPSGIAMIDGRRMDVVSDAEFIDKDTEVVVIEVDGVKITVKRA